MSNAPPARNDDAAAEQRLMALARHDPAQFAPLYERYFDRVYAYCRRRAATDQEAEDLCSLVFTRALKGLATYQGGLVAAWLFAIAHNVVVSHYRRQRPTVALDAVDLADETSAAALEDAERDDILADLVADLTDEQQQILSLTLDAGLTSGQVGALLGKSPVAVRVQLHRIIKGLRTRYLQVTQERAP